MSRVGELKNLELKPKREKRETEKMMISHTYMIAHILINEIKMAMVRGGISIS